MSKELTSRVIECVEATSATMNDWDQRSAIGMADSWVRTGRLAIWNANQQMADGHVQIQVPHRDTLAQSLVDILAGATPKECKTALAAVRTLLNRPFLDPAMLGYQAARAKAGPVGSVKKGEKMGLSTK